MHKIRKYYFINKFDSNNIDKQKINTGIIYRNYNSKSNLSTIIKLQHYCRKKGFKQRKGFKCLVFRLLYREEKKIG